MGLSRRIDLFCLMFSFCSLSPGKARRQWKREERMKSGGDVKDGASFCTTTTTAHIPKLFLFFFHSITNILES